MNLKPMDENTLKFLKDLIDSIDDTIDQTAEGMNSHIAGWLSAEREVVHMAATYFCETPPKKPTDLDDFMEAIKNADTNQ